MANEDGKDRFGLCCFLFFLLSLIDILIFSRRFFATSSCRLADESLIGLGRRVIAECRTVIGDIPGLRQIPAGLARVA